MTAESSGTTPDEDLAHDVSQVLEQVHEVEGSTVDPEPPVDEPPAPPDTSPVPNPE